ncbi:hypothetical protein JXO52_05020 [bacterium]|nr:hypothetical protein [bacterium]
MILLNNPTLRTVTVLAVCALLAAGTAAAQDLTADDVIAKNIEASGGAEAWAKVKTIRMSGTYVNFSDPEKFIMWRARPNLYRFDCKRINYYTVHAYDGKQAWWVNGLVDPQFEKPGPIPSQGNLDKVTLRERFFEPVFWNYKEKGNSVELTGREDLDGDDVYVLNVTLADGSAETWYINAETFLAAAMTGFTYDFGRRCKLDAFFSDYRKVDGIVLPYLIESEYLIRYRSMEIENIEINADDFDMGVFVMPDPEGWEKKL